VLHRHLFKSIDLRGDAPPIFSNALRNGAISSLAGSFASGSKSCRISMGRQYDILIANGACKPFRHQTLLAFFPQTNVDYFLARSLPVLAFIQHFM
jgi:hypothetical protein